MVDCHAVEDQRQNGEDREEGLKNDKSRTPLVKGGTHGEELRRAVLCEDVNTISIHLVGESICNFNARSDSEHKDYECRCYPCSESEWRLERCGWHQRANWLGLAGEQGED